MKKIISPFLISIVILSLCSISSYSDESYKPIVIGEEITINSRILKEERKLLISTPHDYKQSHTFYPVVYLLDGQSNFYYTTGTTKLLTRSGYSDELIVVGIVNIDRDRDFTRPSNTKEFQELMPTAGGAKNFIQFFQQELIPYINKHYRTNDYRILIGHSLGGLFAVDTVLNAPDTFDVYIAISPYLNWDNASILEKAKSVLSKRKSLNKFLFMTLGNEGDEYTVHLDKFTHILKQQAPESLM